jgi:hypothetical protein
MWSVLIMICCFNSGLVVLMGLVMALQWRREAHAMALVGEHEASLHTLAAAVDHLVAHNNLLVGEVTRRRRQHRRVRSESTGSSRSLGDLE